FREKMAAWSRSTPATTVMQTCSASGSTGPSASRADTRRPRELVGLDRQGPGSCDKGPVAISDLPLALFRPGPHPELVHGDIADASGEEAGNSACSEADAGVRLGDDPADQRASDRSRAHEGNGPQRHDSPAH